MGQASGIAGSGLGAVLGSLIAPGIGTSIGASLGGAAGGALGGGTTQQNSYLQPYPGAQGLQGNILQMLMGGGSTTPGSGLNALGGLAGLGSSTGAQRQGTGINQFSNMASPEMQALNTAFPMLQNMMMGNNASGVDALQPVFEQNLNTASNKLTATAPGGRFSSGMLQAQGQLGQQSTNDYNLLASQMIQQGLNRQLQAATTLGGLSSQAGNAQLQALQQLFGGAMGNAFGGSYQTQPSGLQQGMQAGGSLSQLLMLMQRLGQNSGGAMPGMTSPNLGGINTQPMFSPGTLSMGNITP